MLQQMSKKSTAAVRLWCLTWNNYPSDHKERIETMSTEHSFYCGYGLEVAPSTGTPHLQMFVYRPNKFSFKQLSKLFPRCHIEQARGDFESNCKYCSKDTNFIEVGLEFKPQHRGARNDLSRVTEALVNPEATLASLIMDGTVTTKAQLDFFIAAKRALAKPHSGPRRCLWIYGRPGSGKSRYAYENGYVPLTLDHDGKIASYDLETKVLFDDLTTISYAQAEKLKTLCDRYPCKVRVLYGEAPWCATDIIVTSCKHPKDIWPPGDDFRQVGRRFKIISAEDIDARLPPSSLYPPLFSPVAPVDSEDEVHSVLSSASGSSDSSSAVSSTP